MAHFQPVPTLVRASCRRCWLLSSCLRGRLDLERVQRRQHGPRCPPGRAAHFIANEPRYSPAIPDTGVKIEECFETVAPKPGGVLNLRLGCDAKILASSMPVQARLNLAYTIQSPEIPAYREHVPPGSVLIKELRNLLTLAIAYHRAKSIKPSGYAPNRLLRHTSPPSRAYQYTM